MKTEIELTLVRPMHLVAGQLYYNERDRTFDRGVQICATGLHDYVKLPKNTQKITLAFYKRYRAECFEIGRRNVKASYSQSLMFRETLGYCLIDHPKTQLLMSLRREFYRYYIKGYKFFRIEY